MYFEIKGTVEQRDRSAKIIDVLTEYFFTDVPCGSF